jgi:hypothetical protein
MMAEVMMMGMLPSQSASHQRFTRRMASSPSAPMGITMARFTASPLSMSLIHEGKLWSFRSN